MTIEYIKNGDLFESGCEALVNPVNCVGVMGAGLALEFKKRFPAYFEDYSWACRHHWLGVGYVTYYFLGKTRCPKLIISFPTKDHWRDKSELWFIKKGLANLSYDLSFMMLAEPIKSVAVPALGCGLGGLAWCEIKPLMEQAFSQCPDILFKVYEPLEITGQ
jgi:O-acetyl-ADP-ribose deacetylase (regulator of RNase III)